MSVLDYAPGGVDNCRMLSPDTQPQSCSSQNKNVPSEDDKIVVLEYLNDIYRDLENVERVIPLAYEEDEYVNNLRSSIHDIYRLRDMVENDRLSYPFFKHIWSLAHAHFLKEKYLIAPKTQG